MNGGTINDAMELAKLAAITTVIFDVDGVFTNSQMLINEQGHLMRSMNVRDGYAVKVALQQGLRVAIITGGSSIGVSKRLSGLGITEIYSGIINKKTEFENIMRTHQLSKEEILYMGDDIMDIECIQLAGVGACPKDAAPEVLQVTDYVTSKKGGEGCVREILQTLLEIQDKWIPLSK